MENLPSSAAAELGKRQNISLNFSIDLLRSARSAPLVVCKVKRVYIGIPKLIVARRRFAQRRS